MNTEQDCDDVVQLPMVSIDESLLDKEVSELKQAMNDISHSSQKPYIDHLDDAIINDKFLVAEGNKVIIERNTIINSQVMWLDTKEYKVLKIDAESGALKLYEPLMNHFASSNFLNAPGRGHLFKLPTTTSKLRGRGKSKAKTPEKEKKAAGVKGAKGAPGLRRIYDLRGVICTRLKNIAYVAPEASQAVGGERLEVSAPNNGKVIITHPVLGWVETWNENLEM